jgi:hypothetical protein
MPKWVSGKEVTEEEIENSLKAIKEDVCFKCTEHSDKCSIAKAAADIKSMED